MSSRTASHWPSCTGGNRHDITQLLELVHGIPPVRGKRGSVGRSAPPGAHDDVLLVGMTCLPDLKQ